MAKKAAKKQQSKKDTQQQDAFSKLPKDVQEKLQKIKVKLDKFQKQVLEKFDKYIMGIALMPPPKPEELQQLQGPLPPGAAPAPAQMPAPGTPMPAPGQPMPAPGAAPAKDAKDPKKDDKIHVLVLVDDSDSKTMSKLELKDKLTAIVAQIGKDIDPNIIPQTLILSELWQNVYDGKYELLQLIALSAPVHDNGMLQAIKISEIHKSMVLKKFEKYIVSYVLAGSLTQGRATATSDIDVWIVIDDTDVKKMTRVELKDKLRAIIIGMGIEAGEMTGIKNKLNIQVYILTDFWDSLKEANPVIFTLLRDGVPFFDRGIFMPWKQLLKMGKIKPSPEAIDMFMGSGEQVIRRVQAKLNEIGMEDTYYAILTPSQAALMMYGVAPPSPKETAELMREIFVKKEKILEEKYVKILENNVQIRKAIEHGEKKALSGKELDDLLNDGDKFLKRIKRLFTQIEKMKDEKELVDIYDSIITMTRDVLKLEGVEKSPDNEILKLTKDKLVNSGSMPSKFQRLLEDLFKAKKDYDNKKLSKVEIDKLKREISPLIKFLVEHMQRKRAKDFERLKIKVKYGDKFGEVMLLDDTAYIIQDINVPDKDLSKAKIKEDGSLDKVTKATLEEFEKALADFKPKKHPSIREPIFEDLKKIFGDSVEILMSY